MTHTSPTPLTVADEPCPRGCAHPLNVHSTALGCWLCDCTHGRARFRLGRLVATPAATRALARHHADPATLLRRHHAGDWGDADAYHHELNDHAVAAGGLLHSIYQLDADTEIWVITEPDRTATTFLLPDEY